MALRLRLGARRDPVAFRQHADDFAVRVLADLAHQGLAVGLGHPVLRLDAAVGVDAGVEGSLQDGILDGRCQRHGLAAGVVRHVE